MKQILNDNRFPIPSITFVIPHVRFITLTLRDLIFVGLGSGQPLFLDFFVRQAGINNL